MRSQKMKNKSGKLNFGIYPGSATGLATESGMISGPKDDPGKIIEALDSLSEKNNLLVRAYVQYFGNKNGGNLTPENPIQYCNTKRKLDLVICFRTNEQNLDHWNEFICNQITFYKNVISKIQITEEPNNPDTKSGGDGSSKFVKEAIISGVIAAKKQANDLGLNVLVGFNAVISFNESDTFWKDLKLRSNEIFTNSLDYIGLDFYPGVFRPLPIGMNLKTAVSAVLNHFRKENLIQGGFSEQLPIHITENGFPTNDTINEEMQAEAIKEIVETISELSIELKITHYEFFMLRDSNKEGWGLIPGQNFRFGILKEDYSQKKSFHELKKLIEYYSFN